MFKPLKVGDIYELIINKAMRVWREWAIYSDPARIQAQTYLSVMARSQVFLTFYLNGLTCVLLPPGEKKHNFCYLGGGGGLQWTDFSIPQLGTHAGFAWELQEWHQQWQAIACLSWSPWKLWNLNDYSSLEAELEA